MATRIEGFRLDQFRAYLDRQRPAHGIKASVLHHTFRPDAGSWGGIRSMLSIKRYHMNDRGFSDIAANAYAAPDGIIYNARPLSSKNYAHAYVSRHWGQVPADLRILCDGDELWLNKHAFGIETVGNFDNEDPTKSKAMNTALEVLALVHQRYNLPSTRMFFHRHVADKSCPGKLVDLDWARWELSEKLQRLNQRLRVFVSPGSALVECHPLKRAGITRCDIRPLVEALGGEVKYIAITQEVIVRLNQQNVDSSGCDIEIEGQTARCNLRKMAENMGYNVEYDSEGDFIMIRGAGSK